MTPAFSGNWWSRDACTKIESRVRDAPQMVCVHYNYLGGTIAQFKRISTAGSHFGPHRNSCAIPAFDDRSEAGMRIVTALTLLVCVALEPAATSFAQEGHPLKGSWIGEWDSNELHGDSVIVILDWDGNAVTGTINPGTDDIEVDEVTLDPDDWSVTIEADAESDRGPVRYRIEGTINNLELPSRSIVGTWAAGNAGGRFEIVRQ
jgi:hypothetical protein